MPAAMPATCYGKGIMETIMVPLSVDLVEAATVDQAQSAVGVARLLALELFREDKVSLGRAAELCQTAIEDFIEFAAERDVSLHYGIEELEQDRATIQRFFP